MKTLLYISDVFGHCQWYTSEQKRTEGFRRFLPQHGWNVIVMVRSCRCLAMVEDDIPHVDAVSSRCLAASEIDSIRQSLADTGSAVVRVDCRAQWYYRWWLRVASRAGFRYANEDARAEIMHFVEPSAPLASPTERRSPFQKMALLGVKVLARGIPRREVDRLEWRTLGRKVGRQLHSEIGIDCVMGSFPVIQNMELAACTAASCRVPWVADQRDGLVRQWSNDEEELRRARRIFRSAAAAVFAHKEERERDRNLHRYPRYTVENGYLPFPEHVAGLGTEVRPADRPMVFRFLGALYKQRDLKTFLDGVFLFCQTDKRNRVAVRFEYYGATWENAQQDVLERGLDDVCGVNGPVSADEALALTLSADALVLTTNTVGLSGVPGAKLYEYLAARRPILAAGGYDAYADEVLRRTGTGVLCESAPDVSDTLADWITQWKAHGQVPMDYRDDEIRKHSRRESAKILATILDGVVQGELTVEAIAT